MNYRAVKNRCAVILSSLQLPVSDQVAMNMLFDKGFKPVEVDIMALARQCILTSTYRRGAKPSEAPATVDCSSFIKWLYGNQGIWLPRRSIQQRELGEAVSSLDEIIAGDVIFVKGVFDWYYNDPTDGVGHVGIATGSETVIHASDSKVNVVESSISNFVSKLGFRGIRRYIPKNSEVITLEIPSSIEVETMDDLRWIILGSLPR